MGKGDFGMIPVHPQVLAQHGHVQSSIGPANHGQPSRVSTAKFHRIHAKISGINGFLLLSLALRWTTPCHQDPSSSDGPLRVSNALRRHRVTCRHQESGPFVKLQRAFRAGWPGTQVPNKLAPCHDLMQLFQYDVTRAMCSAPSAEFGRC
ncbi:hypothetical protein BGZ61DRAFT_470211 [Ilyonectria robusta]|uniref:uncharacterized protein n=1 Tax=Ilyonectria robusta TaxID=1079257 RepID=UPI001E8CD303|nr:uncharacterized protein BGZ61DRAFT_470211 [Ilyonectria robusta]KAH8736676.1 hypothetical protein BGZ61DRAFT_470211 [Ilyonectria robusta]